MSGLVSLVGAGPGPGLITLLGLERLRACDAVVFDELIDAELLREAPPGAELIAMGKRAGRPSAAQGEIIETLLRLAAEGKRVVRLKGGDPLVFGRGGEELEALNAAGAACELIPGVTSAAAVPALCGIPLTQRGLSRGFAVITAQTADSEALPEYFGALADFPARSASSWASGGFAKSRRALSARAWRRRRPAPSPRRGTRGSGAACAARLRISRNAPRASRRRR